MTIEEYEKETSKLNELELAEFINANPEIAEEWTQLEIKKIENVNLDLSEADRKRMRQKLFNKIRIYELFAEVFE